MLQLLTEKLWHEMEAHWASECDKYEENFEDYAVASLPVLRELAMETPRKGAGVFGLPSGDSFDVLCQANSTFLPGFKGKVLRIRHIVLSPKFDFSDEVDLDDYANALAALFAGAVGLADSEMPSDHVKFHLKSPVERTFGEHFKDAVHQQNAFEKVSMRGSWIYLSKV